MTHSRLLVLLFTIACGSETSGALQRELQIDALGTPQTERAEVEVVYARLAQLAEYDLDNDVDSDALDAMGTRNLRRSREELSQLIVAAGGPAAFDADGTFAGDRMSFANKISNLEIDLESAWHYREKAETKSMIVNLGGGGATLLLILVVAIAELRKKRRKPDPV